MQIVRIENFAKKMKDNYTYVITISRICNKTI